MSNRDSLLATTAIQLVVGLGNPGEQYARTRHNAGFWVLDAWARELTVALKPQAKFLGATARVTVGTREVWLLKPTTFMNHSGEAIKALCEYYQLAAEAVLVVHDELDLNVGTVRLKFAGGHGGHNGLRDVTRLIGERYWRLRVGIDHPGSKELVLPYVLGNPRPDEQALLSAAVTRAVGAVDECCRGAPADVMTLFNRRD
jgi:peptidyl-tRNA hydrolase, PTH1 family